VLRLPDPRAALVRATQAIRLQCRVAPIQCACLIGLTILSGASAPTVAWLSRALLNEVVRGHGDVSRVVVLTCMLIASQALMTTSLYLTGYVVTSASQRLKITMEEQLFRRVATLPGLQRFEDPAWLDKLHLAGQGAERAPQIFVFTQESVRVLVTFLAYLIPLIAIWPPMGLLLLAAAAPAVIGQINQARRRAQVADIVVGTYRRQFFYRALLTEPGAAKELRLFGFAHVMHRRMIDALTRASSAELAVERRATASQALIGLAGAAITGAGILVVVVGAARGRFSVGDVAFFLAAVAGLEGAFAGIVSGAGYLGQHIFLFTKYVEILETEDDVRDGDKSPTALLRGLDLRDVWFRYDEHGPWVLRGLNLFIPQGDTVGIVGLNGAGKSTLVKLMCRFYDPARGSIRWDDTDIRDFRLQKFRERIGATFQDFMSYDLSAAENISLGERSTSTTADVRRAASLAGVDEVLQALPKGYDTVLSRTFVDGEDGSRGAMLSGGQWQRVALARSLMRDDADLLILDEPSSGLDAQAEHHIHEAVAGHGVGRTRVLISHRLASLRGADVIVVLSDGQIIERGTHGELMQIDGEYAHLFRLQADGYQESPADEAAQA
jgi:ATP-binding cassette, subfamily B, bacterial